MTKSECVKLYDVVKGMKCDIVYVYPNRVIGADKEGTSLSEVFCDTGVSESYEIERDVLKLIADKSKALVKVDDDPFEPEDFINRYAIRRSWLGPLEQSDLNMYIIMKGNDIPNCRIDDIKADDSFNEIQNKKAADGMTLYKVNKKYILTLYKGLVPVNKSDRVALELYDIDNYSFLAKFIINKGKFTINKYLVYFFI